MKTDLGIIADSVVSLASKKTQVGDDVNPPCGYRRDFMEIIFWGADEPEHTAKHWYRNKEREGAPMSKTNFYTTLWLP